MLNAFWRRGDVDRQEARGISIREIECSTPFGDGAMWTLRTWKSPQSLLCAQRLLATGRCGRSALPAACPVLLAGAQRLLATGRCGHGFEPEQELGHRVLNAFWRRGDVDRGQESLRGVSVSCAQRLLATGRCGQQARTHPSSAERVLNAFWRRGDVDNERSPGIS